MAIQNHSIERRGWARTAKRSEQPIIEPTSMHGSSSSRHRTKRMGEDREAVRVTLHSSNIHEWQLLSVVHQNKLVIAFCLRWYKKDLTTINFNLIPPICSCCIFFYINKYQKGSFFICGRTTNFLAKDEKCSRLSRKAIGE